MKQVKLLDVTGKTIRGVKYVPSFGAVLTFTDDTFAHLLPITDEWDGTPEIQDWQGLDECYIYYKELEEIGIVKSEIK